MMIENFGGESFDNKKYGTCNAILYTGFSVEGGKDAQIVLNTSCLSEPMEANPYV